MQTLIARYRQAFDIAPSVRRATDMPGRSQVENARLPDALPDGQSTMPPQAMVVAKQHYDYWRPITAIRNGAEDGNPATQPDPAWVPLIATPNFQEYPCGHCTLAGVDRRGDGACERLEAGAGGAGRIAAQPDFGRPGAAQLGRHGRSRCRIRGMYGGVHYRFSNEAGEEIGRKAARIGDGDMALRPLPGRAGKDARPASPSNCSRARRA